MPIEISVVIPTFNRQESLERLLDSFQKQIYKPLEIIIVDGGSEKVAINRLRYKYTALVLVYETTEASVCLQRNTGIRLAKGNYIFLCDDDIELPDDYLSKLITYIHQHPSAGLVTGSVLQKNKKGVWSSEFEIPSFRSLLWKFIFQESVWLNLDHISTNMFTKLPYKLIRSFYTRRNNTCSLAGWPVITEFSYPVYQTAFYGIGASIVKKEWLEKSPYAENLDSHGIGDHYGVLLGFPEFPAVHVNTEAFVFHHKNNDNRLSASLVYYRRILALHYFMSTSKKFSFVNKLWLYWSLIGKSIIQILKKDIPHLKATIKLMGMMTFGKNPYQTKNPGKY